MEENKKTTQSQEPLKIYSAILKFRKEKNGQVSKDIVRVTIRFCKKGPTRKRDFLIPDDPNDPDYINVDNLEWTKYQGKPICVYSRKSKDDYEDSKRISAPTRLCQKLENLVLEVCSENSKQKSNYSDKTKISNNT